MARRANQEGCICKRNDGRWAATLRLGAHRTWVYGQTRHEVADKLRQLQGLAQATGRLPDAGKLTLARFLSLWLEQAAQRLRPKTVACYRSIADQLVIPRLGGIRLSRLNGLTLATHLAHLGQAGVSPFRQRQTYALLRKALGDAVRWGLLANNPAAAVDRPKPPASQQRIIWGADQVAALLAAVESGAGGKYGDLFAFLLAAGCRLGEALGLTWRDIDWAGGTVHIERQITEVDGKPMAGLPKSKAGLRTIVLPGWGMAALERQRVRMRQWQLKSNNPFATNWQRVFTTERGTVPTATNLRRSFRALCAALGLPTCRLHDLRHMSLSLLAAAGVPVRDLQRRAGHSSITVTLGFYVHPAADADRAAAAALERLRR